MGVAVAIFLIFVTVPAYCQQASTAVLISFGRPVCLMPGNRCAVASTGGGAQAHECTHPLRVLQYHSIFQLGSYGDRLSDYSSPRGRIGA